MFGRGDFLGSAVVGWDEEMGLSWDIERPVKRTMGTCMAGVDKEVGSNEHCICMAFWEGKCIMYNTHVPLYER